MGHKVLKKRSASRLSDEQIEYLKEHFHDTPDDELAEVMGISVYTVRARRTKLGLKKDDEFLSKMRSEVAKRCGNGARINTPEAYAKREKKLKENYERDKMRIRWGLEPLCKGRHYRREPVARLLQRNRLQRMGYIIDEQNLIAYYTDDTQRATRLEAIPRGVKKGTIKPYYEFRRLDKESL